MLLRHFSPTLDAKLHNSRSLSIEASEFTFQLRPLWVREMPHKSWRYQVIEHRGLPTMLPVSLLMLVSSTDLHLVPTWSNMDLRTVSTDSNRVHFLKSVATFHHFVPSC
ncbi:hypothetical protein LINPERHAP2_LOCUS26129 [Linum perenne]